MKFTIEVDDSDGIVKMIRAHRKFFGQMPKKAKFEEIEVECPDDDPHLYYLEPEADEIVEGPTAKMESGAFVTLNPAQYGDGDARVAAGKKAPVELKWGEWTVVSTL